MRNTRLSCPPTLLQLQSCLLCYKICNRISRIIEWIFFMESRQVSSMVFLIGHVRYINILTRLWGFQVKLLYLVLFSLYSSLFWELRDKRNLKNLQFWPESLGAMLEYWYIEHGLLRLNQLTLKAFNSPLTISKSWLRNEEDSSLS